MTDFPDDPAKVADPHQPAVTPVSAEPPTTVKKSISMHADVPVWYDCCSCEAEPYWQQAMEEAELVQKDPPAGE